MVYWIIIEGPDNIGKTTLCNSMLSEFRKRGINHEYAHFGAPKAKTKIKQMEEQELTANVTAEYLRKLAKKYVNEDIVILHDRSIFGELVYCKYRGYVADYVELTTKLAVSIKNLQALTFVLYGDTDTIRKFNLKPKTDNAEDYAQSSKMKSVSVDFINKLRALDYGRLMVINSNNYESLNDRNGHVWDIIRAFINNRPYVFKPTDDYQNTPFNVDQNLFIENGFVSNRYACQEFLSSRCSLGEQHAENCGSNSERCHPIAGYGAKNPKYVFVGEVSHYNKRVTTFLPFYNSASGRLFQQMLYNLNISPLETYITNIFKCTPKDNKLGRFATERYYSKLDCVTTIASELLMVAKSGTTVVAIGSKASNILGDSELIDSNFKLVTIHHPSYYIRMGKASGFIRDMAAKLGRDVVYDNRA